MFAVVVIVFFFFFAQGPAAGKTVMVVNINPSTVDFDETQQGAEGRVCLVWFSSFAERITQDFIFSNLERCWFESEVVVVHIFAGFLFVLLVFLCCSFPA